MRIRLTVPKEHVDDDTLGLALQASTAVAQRQVRGGEVPPLTDAIDQGLVTWKPEPADQSFEGFDLPKDVLARGWGDCDDLACWHAADLRESGEDTDALPIVYQSGPNRWHAVVQRGDGSIDDPSQWAGMGRPGGPLPITKPLQSQGPTSSVVGFKRLPSGATKARWDVPLYIAPGGDVVGVAIERAGDDFLDALSRLSNGALSVLALWGAPEDVLVRMHAIAHLLTGGSEEDFYELSGCDYGDCGDFVGALAQRVGAMHVNVNPNDVANIAATVFDPLGIRNMIAPLAQSFVSSYAQGLAQKTPTSATVTVRPKAKKSDDSASSDTSKQTTSGRVGQGLAERASRPRYRYSQSTGLYHPVVGDFWRTKVWDGSGGRPSVGRKGFGTPNPARATHGSSSRGGSRGASSSSRGAGSQPSPSRPTTSSSRAPAQQGQGGQGYDTDVDWSQWDQEFGVDPSTGLPYEQAPYYGGGYGGGYGAPSYGYGYPAQQQGQPSMMVPGMSPGIDPNMPGASDLTLDPYGGLVTPTAFSQYWQAWQEEQPRSAFDDTVMTGDDVPACPAGHHWEQRGSVLVCVPGDSYAES